MDTDVSHEVEKRLSAIEEKLGMDQEGGNGEEGGETPEEETTEDTTPEVDE